MQYGESSETTLVDHSNDVLIVNQLDNFSFIQGPSLNQGRSTSSCAIMHDDEGISYIVVAGGVDGSGGALDSVEILDPNHLVDGQNQWKLGKKICTVQQKSTLTFLLILL